MKEFMDKDFCLENETAKVLYEKYAKNMPIFDYHCHLNPQEIWEDKKFKDITEVWLVEGHYGDHYKWRAIRTRGIAEDYITGDKSGEEKFMKWAEVVPYTIGNPLYHWVHMELREFFKIKDCLSPKTAKEIYDKCNKTLETLTARKMIEMSNVSHLCTTDDPTDSLIYHQKLREDKSFKTIVLPAFRPDKATNLDKTGFKEWIDKLSNVSGIKVDSFDALKEALINRMNFFDEIGCKVSDHGLDDLVYKKATIAELNKIFKKAYLGKELNEDEIAKYKGNLLVFLGREYHKRNWVQQYHIDAIRNCSTKNYKKLGPDTGFDAVNDGSFSKPLKEILDALDMTDELPKTIIYSLDPNEYEAIASLANCYHEAGVKGKVQFGAAWWFNDQKDGMERQIITLASYNLISTFVGMLTDSRSFLSYTRHDYFRRILCTYFGKLIENGEYPNDIEFVGKVIEDICYNNAHDYILGVKNA